MKINHDIGKQHHNPVTQWQSMCFILIENKIIHIHYNDLYGHSLISCLGVKKRKNACSQYDLYGHALPQEPLPCGVMKFTILLDPSLAIITIHLFSLNNASEQRKRFFKKYISFTLFTPKLLPLYVGGHKIHNFLFPYHTDATY